MEEEEAPVPSKKPRLSSGGDGLTAFTLRLAKKLAPGRSDSGQQQLENIVFSPLSIYAALALVAAGARGATLDEILLLLGAASRDELAEFARAVADRVLLKTDDGDGGPSTSSEDEGGGPRVTFAGGVWHDRTVALSPAYRAAAGVSYGAVTRAADFKEQAEEAREEINRWVSVATKQLVASLLPPGSVDSTTRLVLVSAVFFNGTWADPFARKHTAHRRFHRLDGSSVDAPFMRSRRDQFVATHHDDDGGGFKVLKLPYKTRRRNNPSVAGDDDGPRLSMCVFLPDARDGLPRLVETMASSESDRPAGFRLRDRLPTRRVRVTDFALPKFKLSFASRIDGVLRDMGVKSAFDARQADLSDMCEGSSSQLLAVEKVFHKAVIDVNEEGTEAAASTAFIVRKCARVGNAVDFVADHPFAFFVLEEVSGAVVFAGQVLDPTTRSV